MQGTDLDEFLKYLSGLEEMIAWVLEKEKEKERNGGRRRERGNRGREDGEREKERRGEERKKPEKAGAVKSKAANSPQGKARFLQVAVEYL